jgi:lipopolysaccharide biosynthesis glycosyltransferase
MRTFCTIITGNYFPYAITLYRSILKMNPNETMHLLICDQDVVSIDQKLFPGLHFHHLNDIFKQYKADEIIGKYRNNSDSLRWALKPVYINYLLANGFEKVVYTDCDLFFFNDYEFLFEELDRYILTLTPGYTSSNPYVHEEEFLSGYKYGLFNAGFVGANKNSMAALNWWANCCSYKVETDFENGLFVDQKYLDALPVLFDDIGIIRHKGCNVAIWNQHECKRVRKNDQVLINGEYPIVFIHFSNKYIPELVSGNDPLIYPYYLEYEKEFGKSGKTIREFIPGLPEYKKPAPIIMLKRKLLLRTRIKRWFFRLSQIK